MSVPQSAILLHDPEDIRRFSLNWATVRLSAGDHVVTCTCTVEHGTALLSDAFDGEGVTTLDASVSQDVATVWVISAAVGLVELHWHAVTAQGEQLDRTTHIQVTDL